jgi:predicted unusual protein kinase regulating ubiquinone biosynthesis (AarF/ABC1/UbiB family)
MTGDRKLPLGRIRRAVDLARVGARTGGSLILGRGAEGAAEQALEVLSNLRGLAAKLGQTVSYVDGIVPPEHREVFERTLGRLQTRASLSASTHIEELVRSELGGPVTELFSEWEAEPVASASIGQVHRARLHDGRRVAVKLQHPEIERALEQDLQNVSLLEGLINVVGPRGLRAEAMLEEVLTRFREELDYRLEAAQQDAFRRFHADDPRVHVPEVVPTHSSRRVLTSEWVDGQTLEEVRSAPEALRRTYAEVMWRFVFRGNLVAGRFNADPHPGNYLFHADGKVTFLDFGCVQPIAEDLRRSAVKVHERALDKDEDGFRRAIAQMMGTHGGRYEQAMQEYVRRCFEPVFSSPFRLDHAYASSLFAGAKDFKKAMYARDGSFKAPPPGLALMNRLQFGFYSVLARLDVTVDYHTLERDFVAEAAAVDRAVLA